MFRKISITLVAAAALGSAALAPTSVSAWGRGGGFGALDDAHRRHVCCVVTAAPDPAVLADAREDTYWERP